jgi:hypothetical protein
MRRSISAAAITSPTTNGSRVMMAEHSHCCGYWVRGRSAMPKRRHSEIHVLLGRGR